MKDELAEQDVRWGGGSSVGKNIPESRDGICTGWERQGVCVLLGTRRIVKSPDAVSGLALLRYRVSERRVYRPH